MGITDLSETIKTLEGLKAKINAKQVVADPDIAKVSLIGAGMVGQPGVAAKLFKVLGASGINIKMIASSEKKLTCVVAKNDADRAAQLMHDAFELGT